MRIDLDHPADSSAVRWCGNTVMLGMRSAGKAALVDVQTGEVASWRMSEGDESISAYDELHVALDGEHGILAHRSRVSHGGDMWTTVFLFRRGVETPIASFDQTSDVSELRWALGARGHVLVTNGDEERARLVAQICGPDGRAVAELDVGGEDEYRCDAVALDTDGGRVLVAYEAGIQQFAIKQAKAKRGARWEPPGAITRLQFATSVAAFGIEEGKRGIVWMMRTGVKPPVIGAGLAVSGPTRFLAIEPTEAAAWWIAHHDGAPVLCRLRLADGVTEIAEVDAAGIVAVDPSCERIARLGDTSLAIEPAPTGWRTAD